jgi:hypothetical protein
MPVTERVPDVVFKTRVRDESIGGSKFLGAKELLYFPCPEPLLPPAPPAISPAMKNSTKNSSP